MHDEQLQLFLLLALHALQPHGSREADLLTRARSATWRGLAPLDLQSALLDLETRLLVQRYKPTFGGERWIITGLGTAALQQQGVV